MLFINHEPLTLLRFPAGEQQLNLADDQFKALQETEKIVWKYSGDESIMEIFQLNSILIQAGLLDKKLVVTYMPYARMDRTSGANQSFSLDAIARLLVHTVFAEIAILEPHSDKTLELFDFYKKPNQNVRDFYLFNEELLVEFGFNTETDVLVFPDKGAMLRYKDRFPNVANLMVGAKNRDFETGQIKGITVSLEKGSVEKANKYVVIDDICSYGGTFVGIKEAITQFTDVKDEQTFELYVTHAEPVITKGKVFDNYDKVITTDSLYVETEPHDKLIVLNYFS